MTREEALEQALMSLLDVVEELVMGIAHGQTPSKEWADQVQNTFDEHRQERLLAS
jgi:hypothetical protein